MTFFSKTGNVIETTYAFLQALNVKTNYNYLKERLIEHPDYPSLLAISEVFEDYKIENYAAQLSPNDLLEVPMPCLASLNIEGGIFALVNDVQNGIVNWWHFEKGKQQESIASFAEKWNGVLLLTQTSEASIEPNYTQNRQKILINWASIIGSILIFVIGFYLLFSVNVFSIILLCFIKFLGFVTSVFLLWRLVDRNNPSLKNICQINSNVNCDSVLDSKAATIGGILSWSEIGYFYFTGSLLSLLFTSNNQEVIQNLAFLNLLTLPYTVFSIYYQGFVLKKWCVLCIATQIILWLEFFTFNSLVSSFYQIFSNYKESLILIIAFLLPIVIWFSLKPIFQKVINSNFYEQNLKSFQNNIPVFFTLLRQERHVTQLPKILIYDGNLKAQNTILAVTHPYCSHCANNNKVLKQIICKNSDVLKSQIVFVSSNVKEDRSTVFVQHLFSLDAQIRNEALDFWFEESNKDFEFWSKKYPVMQITTNALEITEQHYAWCVQNDIIKTPTFFVNGYCLPKLYKIGDIKRIASRIFQ